MPQQSISIAAMLQPARLRHVLVLTLAVPSAKSPLKFPPDTANARSYSRAVASSDLAPDETDATDAAISATSSAASVSTTQLRSTNDFAAVTAFQSWKTRSPISTSRADAGTVNGETGTIR